MSLEAIISAKSEAVAARARFDATLAEAQDRFKPGSLAGEAWDGVKEKSAEVAEDAIDGVRNRPVAAGATLGAVALFLARGPLWRVAKRTLGWEPDENSNEEKE